MKRLIGLVLSLLFIFGCGGGAKYWMVNDPLTKNIYYTQKIDNLSSGAVKFTDAQTGKTVSIQNSEVKKITEDEFKAGMEQKKEQQVEKQSE